MARLKIKLLFPLIFSIFVFCSCHTVYISVKVALPHFWGSHIFRNIKTDCEKAAQRKWRIVAHYRTNPPFYTGYIAGSS